MGSSGVRYLVVACHWFEVQTSCAEPPRNMPVSTAWSWTNKRLGTAPRMPNIDQLYENGVAVLIL